MMDDRFCIKVDLDPPLHIFLQLQLYFKIQSKFDDAVITTTIRITQSIFNQPYFIWIDNIQ